MNRLALPWVLTACLASVAVTHAVAQSDDEDAPASEEATQNDETAADEVSVGEDAIFSDGVFKPSEKIEADSEISLPSDI